MTITASDAASHSNPLRVFAVGSSAGGGLTKSACSAARRTVAATD
ncbi:MAG: hypothetical protein E6H66_00150 [Betaproteobacteria bacterium]|nr:MAG: hypothetical protein E6H66_00150 [Betaproteobacteria bacterium]